MVQRLRLSVILIVLILPSACTTAPTVAEQSPPASVSTVAPVEPVVRAADEVAHQSSPDGQTTVQQLAHGHNAYLGRINLAPGAEVPPHRHAESEEYLYILSGGGVLTIEGREYRLRPEMVVLIPAGAEHSYVNGPHVTAAFQVFSTPEGAARFLEWPEAVQPVTNAD